MTSGTGRRAPIKFSGLVAAGKVKLAEEKADQDNGQTVDVAVNTPAANEASDAHLSKQPAISAAGDAAGGVRENDQESTTDQESSAKTADTMPEHAPATPKDSAGSAVKPRAPGRQVIPLDLVDDSPYQPRTEYDPEEIDALATTMSTAGLSEPIRVRLVGNRYQLLSGHRRKRAALSLGWTEIEAFVELHDDKRAMVDTWLSALGTLGMPDYDTARMLQEALNQEVCTSQRQLAAFAGLNLSKVNGCLQMLQLPKSILAYLDKKPSLFSYETARVILGLIKDYPNNLAEIERGVERLFEGKAQNSLKGWVLQAIKGRPSTEQDRNLITNSGRLIFVTKRDAAERSVVVNCKSQDVDLGEFEKKLQAWLEEQAQSVVSSPDAGVSTTGSE